MVLVRVGQNILSGCLHTGIKAAYMLYIIESLPSELIASSAEPSALQSQVLIK